MTYSDEECREVAEKLRHEAACGEDVMLLESWARLQSIVCGCDDFPYPPSLFECLADLIDQPRVAYCPFCGREVVVE